MLRDESPREVDGLPEYELRSDESRPLAVRPPEDAPSRYEPELGREPPDEGLLEDGRPDEEFEGPLRLSDDLPDALAPRDPPDDGLLEEDLGDEEREPLPPRPLGREPE